MNIRKLLMAATLVAGVAVSGLAALSGTYADFGKGPATFLMTKEEVAQWKNIKTDDEAKDFIELFWAKRDPSPGTARNEFREEFDARVKAADQTFTAGRKAGSMSDRGKVLILFGKPTAIKRDTVTPQSGIDDRGFGINADNNTSTEKAPKMIWSYQGDAAQKAFNAPLADLDFIDQYNNRDFMLQRGKVDVGAAQQRAIAAAITQPNLTVPPSKMAPTAIAPAATPSAAAAAVVAAPPAVMTAFKTADYQTAVEAFRLAKTNPYKNLYVTWGEYVTPQGEYFVPVELYVPKVASLTASQDLTFFGVVSDSTGKPIAVFEEPAKLTETKGDLFFDKSLVLPAGQHKGIFGLAQNGKPISMVQTDMTLAGSLNKDEPAVSNLILSNNLYPLTVAQRPTDPFAFGGVKVVPKADKTFVNSDELWYFFEVRNPGLTETNTPKLQVKLTIEGKEAGGKGEKVSRSAPPREVEAQELKGVPGHYGVGSSIPLSSFKPGDYSLKVKVTDTVSKKSYELQDTFKIVAEAK